MTEAQIHGHETHLSGVIEFIHSAESSGHDLDFGLRSEMHHEAKPQCICKTQNAEQTYTWFVWIEEQIEESTR